MIPRHLEATNIIKRMCILLFFKALEMLFLHLAVSVVLIFVSETAQNVAENSCLGFQNIVLQRF